MDDAPRALALPPPSDEPALETRHARALRLGASGPLPEGCELAVALPSATRLAYVPLPVAPGEAAEVAADPFLRGNAFRPVHQSERTLAAAFSLAAGRRMESGPESERLFVFLRGTGLVFLENGDALRFAPEHLVVVPPGEPAAVWAQGPEDVLGVVVQPRGAAAPRRTLAGEIARRRGPA